MGVNAQIGKENEQVVGVSNDYGSNNVTVQAPVVEGSPSSSPRPVLRPPSIDQVQKQDNTVQADEVKSVVINEVPIWIVLVALVGWLLPTPTQIGHSFANLIGIIFKGRSERKTK